MDPTSIGPGLAIAIYVGKTAGRLVERAAGPAADEFGLWFRDRIADYRRRNAQKVLERSSQMLAAARLAPGEIPPGILLPLLEGASLEEIAEMQERWAAMLANAAVDETLEPILARILTQLRPRDAAVLDAVGRLDEEARNASPVANADANAYVASRKQLLHAVADLAPEDLEICLDTLEALRCIESEPGIYPLNERELHLLTFAMRLTPLGRRFLQVGSPPVASDAG